MARHEGLFLCLALYEPQKLHTAPTLIRITFQQLGNVVETNSNYSTFHFNSQPVPRSQTHQFNKGGKQFHFSEFNTKLLLYDSRVYQQKPVEDDKNSLFSDGTIALCLHRCSLYPVCEVLFFTFRLNSLNMYLQNEIT